MKHIHAGLVTYICWRKFNNVRKLCYIHLLSFNKSLDNLTCVCKHFLNANFKSNLSLFYLLKFFFTPLSTQCSLAALPLHLLHLGSQGQDLADPSTGYSSHHSSCDTESRVLDSEITVLGKEQTLIWSYSLYIVKGWHSIYTELANCISVTGCPASTGHIHVEVLGKFLIPCYLCLSSSDGYQVEWMFCAV